MQLFKYIVIDKQGITRIGYLESDNDEQLRTNFTNNGVKRILNISKAVIGNLKLLENRKTFTYEAIQKNSTILYGTIESISIIDAYKELSEDYRLNVIIIAEGKVNISKYRDQFIDETNKLKEKIEKMTKSKDLDLKSAEFFQNKKLDREEESHVKTIIDNEFNDLLESIRNDTKEVLLDKQFHDEIDGIHTSINILLEKEFVSLDQKYDFLIYTLRELSYAEDALDPSAVKDALKEVLARVVSFIKKLDKLRGKQPKKETDQSGNESSIFGDLGESFKKYQNKKNKITSIAMDIEEKKLAEVGKSNVISVSSFSIILRELPIITMWLIITYMISVIIGVLFETTGAKLKLFNLDIRTLFLQIVTEPIFIKIILFLILIHILINILDKYQFIKHKNINYVSVAGFLVLSVGVFLI